MWAQNCALLISRRNLFRRAPRGGAKRERDGSNTFTVCVGVRGGAKRDGDGSNTFIVCVGVRGGVGGWGWIRDRDGSSTFTVCVRVRGGGGVGIGMVAVPLLCV